MKYLALALALLLAVGSHAAPATDNLPLELEEFRENMGLYLTKAKDYLVGALSKIENEETRVRLTNYVDALSDYIQLGRGKVEPYTNAAVATVMGATAELRAGIKDDFDNLKSNIQPSYDNLEQVLEKHLDEYKEVLSSHFDDSEWENLKAKYLPLVDSLKSKLVHNVEETKTALQPILDAIRAKLEERAGTAKAIADPYIEEYRDKLSSYASEIAGKAQSIGTGTHDLVGLQGKVAPVAAEIFAKLQELGVIVSGTFNKQ